MRRNKNKKEKVQEIHLLKSNIIASLNVLIFQIEQKNEREHSSLSIYTFKQQPQQQQTLII